MPILWTTREEVMKGFAKAQAAYEAMEPPEWGVKECPECDAELEPDDGGYVCPECGFSVYPPEEV